LTTVRLSCIVFFLFVLVAAVQASDRLSSEEERGKRIYFDGAAASGTEISVTFGQGTGLSATAFPCVDCHGRDGRGKPEGGVNPADITWDTLTTPGTDSRRRPAYTPRTLIRAIAMGFDSSGAPLDAAMPRFHLSRSDADNLIAYLKKLAEDLDPGLSPNSIRLGAILPPAGQMDALREQTRQALTVYFDGINRGGGIYGRKIDLLFFASLPESTDIFALVSSFITGGEAEAASVLAARGLPLVGAFALFPRIGEPLNRYILYLDGGVPDQASALLNFALADRAASKTVVILHSENALVAEAAKIAAAQARGLGARAVSEVTSPALEQEHPDVLLILAPGFEVADWMDSISKLSPAPVVLIPGLFATRTMLDRIPKSIAGRVHFAVYPSAGGDQAIRNQAMISAAILVEALKRVGSNLSREALLTQLEGLYEFQTGAGPVVTFGPNRRIGISPASISIQ
jgi:ABC-type branched-subunit amino acid transport system substrate-binding protein